MERVESLLAEFNSALNAKENIVSNLEPYYYYETVHTKRRRRFAGIVVSPTHEEHQERRFNQGLYDQAVINANAEINRIGNEIESTLNNLRNNMQAQNNELNDCNARYQTALHNNNQLSATVEQKRTELQKLNDDNTKVQECMKNKANLQDSIKLQTDAVCDIFKSFDSVIRSYFLSELWFNRNDHESANAIALIKSLGFDASMLAYYATVKNSEELLDVAIENKASFSNYFIEDMSLLQHIIYGNNEKLFEKIMALKDLDISGTVLNAIDNDMKTIDKLLNHGSISLTKQTFFGYTLLQIAIDVNNEELVEKILSNDSSCVNIQSNSGESAFKIAVRSGHENIIERLKNHVDLKNELEQLDLPISIEVKEKMLNDNDIEGLIQMFKGDSNLSIQYSVDAKLKNSESDILRYEPELNHNSILESLNLRTISLSLKT